MIWSQKPGKRSLKLQNQSALIVEYVQVVQTILKKTELLSVTIVGKFGFPKWVDIS